MLQTMHPEDIKSTLRKTGTTASSLARGIGVSHQAISSVIHGRFRSLRIARRICEITGLDPSLTWPGRYPELRLDPIRFQTSPFKEVA
jgi:lambda repressor-like predicted transcriptional regulator